MWEFVLNLLKMIKKEIDDERIFYSDVRKIWTIMDDFLKSKEITNQKES